MSFVFPTSPKVSSQTPSDFANLFATGKDITASNIASVVEGLMDFTLENVERRILKLEPNRNDIKFTGRFSSNGNFYTSTKIPFKEGAQSDYKEDAQSDSSVYFEVSEPDDKNSSTQTKSTTDVFDIPTKPDNKKSTKQKLGKPITLDIDLDSVTDYKNASKAVEKKKASIQINGKPTTVVIDIFVDVVQSDAPGADDSKNVNKK